MFVKLSDIDPRIQKILLAYPVRNPVSWRKEHGIVVITYKKNFTRFEKRLHRVVGGPKVVRRTMDEKSTIIWERCDGRHNIKDICDELDIIYREEIEPVLEYVHKVLVILLERNLIHLEQEQPAKPLPVRKLRVMKSEARPHL